MADAQQALGLQLADAIDNQRVSDVRRLLQAVATMLDATSSSVAVLLQYVSAMAFAANSMFCSQLLPSLSSCVL